METEKNRTEKCREKVKKLFLSKPVRNEGRDPEFMRILQRFIFGEVSYTGSLDDRMRELVTLTVLAVVQALPQLKAHTAACLNIGASPLEVRETVYQCAPFIGFPKTLNAIAAMNEAFEERGISLPLEDAATVTEDDRFKKGACGADGALRRRDKAKVCGSARRVFGRGAALSDGIVFRRLCLPQRARDKGERAPHRGHARRYGRDRGAGEVPRRGRDESGQQP